jgi:hypothetical protein
MHRELDYALQDTLESMLRAIVSTYSSRTIDAVQFVRTSTVPLYCASMLMPSPCSNTHVVRLSI